MSTPEFSQRSEQALAAGSRIFAFLLRYGTRPVSGDVCDFMAGNPTGPPIPGYIEALQESVVPDSPAYFRYGPPWQPAIDAAAAALGGRLNLALDPADLFLTRGAASGLVTLLRVLVDPGDEVVMMSPPWFFYESLVLQEGGRPVKVALTEATFDLDLEAIGAALTPKTRVVLINTPHNPSGRIYPAADLAALGRILDEGSARFGRRIYLISDEAYARILFDGNEMVTPAHHYPATFILHTYSKTLLAPMQRAGYLALAPGMPGAERLRPAILWSSLTSSAPPDTGMQHAIGRLEELIIDLGAIEARRNRLVAALSELGYRLETPQAGFYLFARTPARTPTPPAVDAVAFCDWLAERQVYTLPGEAFERPGYFRLSLTATDAMVDRALPILAEAYRHFTTAGTAVVRS